MSGERGWSGMEQMTEGVGINKRALSRGPRMRAKKGNWKCSGGGGGHVPRTELLKGGRRRGNTWGRPPEYKAPPKPPKTLFNTSFHACFLSPFYILCIPLDAISQLTFSVQLGMRQSTRS